MAAPQHVALLRAINVGGTGKLPMADLRRMLEAVGCRDVRTYIQSGNALFRATARVAARLPARLGDVIEQERGFRPPIVMRSEVELRAVHASHPFGEVDDPKTLHVAFLAAAPEPGATLDPARSPDDRFELRGRDLYLFLPNGAGQTKFDNGYIERRLSTTSTVRNWRTVSKLVEMLG